ncbi:MAG TPA: FixH family protein [Syntrophales bacterium]|nr:FixH family protein [Syntrophales bacterium]
MRRIALIVCVLLLAGGLAYAKDYEMTKKAGEYTVSVTIDKNPPITGKNNMAVGIKDGTGKDVTDAAVAVDYGMPAMPGMPAMNYKAGANPKDKLYLATLDFSMSGPWSVTIKITRGGKTQSVKLNVDVK